MFDSLHSVPWSVWTILAALALVALCRPTTSRRVSTWGRYDAADDDNDLKPLGQPVRVRHGVVLDRSEVEVPRFDHHLVHRPLVATETRFKFVVLCHDKSGDERLEVTVPKTADNRYAEVGRQVEVRSYRSHSLSAKAIDAVAVVA